MSEPSVKCCFDIVDDAPFDISTIPQETFTVKVGVFNYDVNGERVIMKPSQSVNLELLLLYYGDGRNPVENQSILVPEGRPCIGVDGYANLIMTITENSFNSKAFGRGKATADHKGRSFVIQITLAETEFKSKYDVSTMLHNTVLHTVPMRVRASAWYTRSPPKTMGKRTSDCISTDGHHSKGPTTSTTGQRKSMKKGHDTSKAARAVASYSSPMTPSVPLSSPLVVLGTVLGPLTAGCPDLYRRLMTWGEESLLLEVMKEEGSSLPLHLPLPSAYVVSDPPVHTYSTIASATSDIFSPEEYENRLMEAVRPLMDTFDADDPQGLNEFLSDIDNGIADPADSHRQGTVCAVEDWSLPDPYAKLGDIYLWPDPRNPVCHMGISSPPGQWSYCCYCYCIH